jgi:predicted ATPase with chaperone activity
MKRLQPLDIVRTSFGTLCVVNEVNSSGSVSLVLPAGSSQKYAWYKPSELVFVGSLTDVCSKVPTLTQKKPAREKPHYSKAFNDMYEDIMGNQHRNQFGMN